MSHVVLSFTGRLLILSSVGYIPEFLAQVNINLRMCRIEASYTFTEAV